MTKISGKIISIFPDNINTDDIIPAWTLQESINWKFFAHHAFANYDKKFVKRCSGSKNNIIVAGKYFGCGSSREQAIYALKGNGVVAVIAKSYPDIFYRNSVNNGLVLITIKDTSDFNLNDNITIDFDKHIISRSKKKWIFDINRADLEVLKTGDKKERVIEDLKVIINLSNSSLNRPNYKIRMEKPQTITEKIISDHLGKHVYASERIEKLPVDVLYFNGVIGPPVMKMTIESFSRYFKDKKFHCFNPEKIFFIPDHTVPSSSVSVSEGITLMEEFSKEHKIKCYKEGDGIEHIVMIEDGYILPGMIILGTDSHTDTNGALNNLSFGVGTTDASYALTTGFLYDFEIPKTVRINIEEKFPNGVFAKDLILHLIGKLGVDGANKQVIEFGGNLANISMEGRTTVANMAVEMGARTAIFESDVILDDYLENRVKSAYRTYKSDPGCRYEKVLNVNLSDLEPCVAFPHKPGNVTFISRINQYMKKSWKSKGADFAPVRSLKISDAFLGACTNGKYEDFLEASKILKGRKVHPDVNFIVIPASRKIYNRLLDDGILQIFIKAGVNVESSNCGPCFGKHMGVIGKGAQMISSSNRNYIGRMGSSEAKIFLASPATVTASAIAGEIIDPRKYL